MLEALPLDERRDLEAQIEISFWGRALGQRAAARAPAFRVRPAVRPAARPPAARRPSAASWPPTATSTWPRTSSSCSSTACPAQRVLYPDRVTPQRQVEMLDHLLRQLPVIGAAAAARPRQVPAPPTTTRASVSVWLADAERSMSFGAIAGDYDRLRPGPPPAAVDWLLPASARTSSSISGPAPAC